MTAAVITHIFLDDRGVAWIDDTNAKVIEVVLNHTAYGWSAAEIHENLPHLSLAQIHAALAYYYDHRNEFDALIERQYQEIETMRSQSEQPTRAQLEARLREEQAASSRS